MSDGDKKTNDSGAPQPEKPFDPIEAIEDDLTVTDVDKETDDEMSRPADDRSPLT